MRAQGFMINTSSSGNLTVQEAVSGKLIYVVAFYLVVGGATNIKFTDGSGGATISGQMNIAANGGIVSTPPGNLREGEYWFKTSVGTALVFNSSSAVQVGGIVRYVITSA